MLVYQSVITALLVLLLVNTFSNLRVLRKPAKRPPPAEGPLVSVLVPARNEERKIGRCVESLAQQDYPNLEILVLDDHSEDWTAAIVEGLARRYPRVRLLRGKPLPPGWHGKAYACAQLAQEARGEWLLFVDADTVHAPECVSTTLQVAQERRADLLTMMPRILDDGFGVALVLALLPLTFGALLPMGLVTRGRWSLLAGALGPFMLFRRESYQRIGGHEATRMDIVEDMKLSRLIKQHGGRLVWIDGTGLMQVRFYDTFGEAWRGLAKSTFAALNYSVLGLLGLLIPCIALFLMPYGFLVAGLVTGQVSAALFWLPLSQVLLTWAFRLVLAQRFQMRRSMALLHAVTMAVAILFTLHSTYQALFGGGITWKGRAYQFRSRGQPATLRAELAAGLEVVRLGLAGLLGVLGWRWGSVALGVAATLPLINWTCGLLAHALADQPAGRLTLAADVSSGLGSLAYLLLSGLLTLWLALLAVLLVLGSKRWLPWRGMAMTGSVTLGSVLLFIAGVRLPLIRTLLAGWLMGVALLARRAIIQFAERWFQRLRHPS